jgi:acyl carrier protein
MINASIIEQKMRSDVLSQLLSTAEPQSLDRDDDLLQVLDSLQILRMTVQMEATFGIRVENGELTAANVGTLGRLTAFISDKIDRAASRS